MTRRAAQAARFATWRHDRVLQAPLVTTSWRLSIDALATTPTGASHWSTRSLAAKHGISRQTVVEIWRAFGLRPSVQDEFKISPDPAAGRKIRDIVALYMNPPVAARVVAADEKSPRSRR